MARPSSSVGSAGGGRSASFPPRAYSAGRAPRAGGGGGGWVVVGVGGGRGFLVVSPPLVIQRVQVLACGGGGVVLVVCGVRCGAVFAEGPAVLGIQVVARGRVLSGLPRWGRSGGG